MQWLSFSEPFSEECKDGQRAGESFTQADGEECRQRHTKVLAVAGFGKEDLIRPMFAIELTYQSVLYSKMTQAVINNSIFQIKNPKSQIAQQ